MTKEQVLAALQANKSTCTGIRLDAKKVYTVLLTGDITVRLPQQAQDLLAIMFGEEQTSWTEVELYELFATHTEISEKQTPWAIFKFYRTKLVETGFLTVK